MYCLYYNAVNSSTFHSHSYSSSNTCWGCVQINWPEREPISQKHILYNPPICCDLEHHAPFLNVPRCQYQLTWCPRQDIIWWKKEKALFNSLAVLWKCSSSPTHSIYSNIHGRFIQMFKRRENKTVWEIYCIKHFHPAKQRERCHPASVTTERERWKSKIKVACIHSPRPSSHFPYESQIQTLHA